MCFLDYTSRSGSSNESTRFLGYHIPLSSAPVIDECLLIRIEATLGAGRGFGYLPDSAVRFLPSKNDIFGIHWQAR